MAPWDLEINKSIISPADISTITWNSLVTYRLEFTNNGPARDDIAIQDLRTDKLVSYAFEP